MRDGTFGVDSKTLGDFRKVWGGVVDPDPDALVLHRPSPHQGHALLVLLVVVVRAVVAHDDEERQPMVREGMEAAEDVEQIAVRLKVDAQPS